jgi:transcriptional regulator with XRE-family HTH domain
MENLRRMRLLCELTQQQLSSATGVPMYRISGAETQRVRLTEAEMHLLTNFLHQCWRNISEAEVPVRRAPKHEQAVEAVHVSA